MSARRSSAILGLSVTTALALAACGSSSSSGSGSSSGSSSGSASTPYAIGVLNSTTGALGAIGQQETQGIDLAVSELNAAGGVNGHPLKTETVDDQGSVNLSTAAFKKLATSDKVAAIIGPGVSATAKAVAPLADQYGVAQILIIAQPEVANGTKNVFEVPPPGFANAQAMVGFAKSNGVKTAGLIYANNPYGQAGMTDITDAAGKQGVTLQSSDSWDPAKFDFTAQVSKVTAGNPDAVFLYGSGGTSDALLLKATRAGGYKGKVIGDLTYSTSTIPAAAGDAANSVVALTAVNYGSPSADEQKLFDSFKAKYGALPTVLSVYSYTAVKLVAAGMAKAGKYDGNAIAKAIEGLQFPSTVGQFAYTPDYHAGPGATAFKPVSFKDGTYTTPSGG